LKAKKNPALCLFQKQVKHINRENKNFAPWCLCGKNDPKQANPAKTQKTPKKLCHIKTVIPVTYKKD